VFFIQQGRIVVNGKILINSSGYVIFDIIKNSNKIKPLLKQPWVVLKEMTFGQLKFQRRILEKMTLGHIIWNL